MKNLLNVGLLALCLLAMAGCCHQSSICGDCRLYRDKIPGRKGMVADYDSMVFSSGGAEVYGQILKPDRSYGEGRPCVIIFHGFAGFARFDDIGQALCRSGCVVIIPHHRGAWGSQGKYSVTNCVQDAVNLVRYAQSDGFQRKYHTGPQAVFLVGHSMGGNTVLNAAGQISGVCGIVMLDPCDIGGMTLVTDKKTMIDFLVDNGLNILNTDGGEAVYRDLATHAEAYAYANAVTRLNRTSVLRLDAQWGLDETGERMKSFGDAVKRNKRVPRYIGKIYPCNHGMMGVRTMVSKDISDFIGICLAPEAQFSR